MSVRSLLVVSPRRGGVRGGGSLTLAAGLAGFRRTGWAMDRHTDVSKPRRTRAGVSRPGGGRSQGRRRSSARGRARRSWPWAVMISLDHVSAACRLRILGAVRPRTCSLGCGPDALRATWPQRPRPSAIAHLTGYGNEASFSTAFAGYSDACPRQYRRERLGRVSKVG